MKLISDKHPKFAALITIAVYGLFMLAFIAFIVWLITPYIRDEGIIKTIAGIILISVVFSFISKQRKEVDRCALCGERRKLKVHLRHNKGNVGQQIGDKASLCEDCHIKYHRELWEISQ